MKLKPEELEEKGYVLLDEMNHAEIVPFVRKFLQKRTWFASFYYICVIVSFSLFFFAKIYQWGATASFRY